MHKILRTILNKLNILLGNRVNEFYWKYRHYYFNRWPEKYLSKESINAPHRKALLRIISKCRPFDNIFEIGCASGPNLYLLAKNYPKIKILGSDISKPAIMYGKKWFEEKNIKSISLFVSKAEESFKRFPDKSIDIIFSCAALIYLDSKTIKKTIREIMRVCRKKVIFIEYHTKQSNSFFDSCWYHNYEKLFAEKVSKQKIKITQITPKIWSGNWVEHGHIIEINLQK